MLDHVQHQLVVGIFDRQTELFVQIRHVGSRRPGSCEWEPRCQRQRWCSPFAASSEANPPGPAPRSSTRAPSGTASSAQLWLLGYPIEIVAIVADGHRLEATLVHQTTTVQRVAEAGRHHLPGVAQSVDAADLVPVVCGDRPFGDAGTRVEQLKDDLWPLRSRGPTIGSGPFSRCWSLFRIDVGSVQCCSLRYS